MSPNSALLQDPRWTEVSASLRGGILHVKMPREKAIALVTELTRQDQDLSSKKVLDSERSLVFSGPIDDWNHDLVVLKALEPSALVAEVVLAISAGLVNDVRYDWLSRVGGPPREELDALGSLFLDSGDFVL